MKEIKLAMSREIVTALHDAGVITNPPDRVGRVVIDLKPGDVGRIYVEHVLGDEFVDVILGGGLKVEVSS